MKDSLFEMLLSLFEKTLSKLKEHDTTKPTQLADKPSLSSEIDTTSFEIMSEAVKSEYFKSSGIDAMRILTYEEQMKLTKASYQFLMRLLVWGVVNKYAFELIINQLVFSESRIVTLEETKQAVRYVLADDLNPGELAFLDLVLYQSEGSYSLH